MSNQRYSKCFCRRSKVGLGLLAAAMVASLVIPKSVLMGQDAKPAPKEKTLYQRIGGYDVIAGLVDDFIGQLKTDKAFERFGGGRSMSSLEATRQLVVEQICNLSGGPCLYIGRPTKMAHQGLKITQEEWESSMKKWKNSLNKFKIAEPEQKDFLALIEGLQKDIVEVPDKDKSTGDSSKKYQN